MRELQIEAVGVQPRALHEALAGLLGDEFIGVSTYGADRPISIWLDDNSEVEAADLAGVLAVHDPVHLASDKTSILADGEDEAIVYVWVPRGEAESVVLLIGGSRVVVELSEGEGQVAVTCLDPMLIEIGVENPANRYAGTLNIRAV